MGSRSLSPEEKVEVFKEKRVAVYAGSFDPITFGHIALIGRGLKLFDEIVVLVATNPKKQSLFTVEERVTLIKEAVPAPITVDTDNGLLAIYMQKHGYRFLLRGLRAVSDFDYEFQMSLTNRHLVEKEDSSYSVESVFLMADEAHLYVSSSMVREVAVMGGDASQWVTPNVWKALQKKRGS
ncbi:MAG: pantetheine-phosphate adenylyltransferase [Bacteroidota bacterium]